ncbi:unnamed protein product [Diplocarpon coronariae]
MRPQL